MRLRDLLDISELRLVLRSGTEALDRSIRWVYTTEIVESGRYLSGNELVLTGLMWHKGQEDPDGFVATLVDAAVSALGVGMAVHGQVPPDIVAACRRQGLPLIEIPADVSFGTVSEVVTRRLTAERAAGLATVLGRHRRLIASVAEGAGLDSVFTVTRQDLGRGCWVLSPTGRIVVGAQAGPELSKAQARSLAAEFLAAERLPHVVRMQAGAFTLLPINTRAGHRIASWFLVCEGELVESGEEIRETAYELAALAALERARLEEGRRVERRLVAELVELAARSDPAEVMARMRTCGLSPTVPYVAVSAAVSDVAHPAEVSCAVLEEVLGEGAIGTLGAEAVGLIPVPPDGAPVLVARLREAVGRLAPALTRERLTVGVSGPAQGPGGLGGMVDEARHTRRLAGLRPGRAQVVTSDEIHSHVLLLATVPEGVRRSFRERLLRPLYEYDAEHHSDLVHTLDAFLDCSGSWNRCAAELHVHVNTLRYRIRRIEELTGRDLGTLENRVDFFLALRAT
ncbi:MAG: putative transcriptional regulator, PucR family [Actinomycetia bacterium]|nr:putative transcriptional regulator, PucR family [Actinomycetes bacterium]